MSLPREGHIHIGLTESIYGGYAHGGYDGMQGTSIVDSI